MMTNWNAIKVATVPPPLRLLDMSQSCIRNELPRVDLGLVHPIHQLEVPPGQPCALGVERLRLGRLPQGAVFSRVLSIRNCLSTEVREHFLGQSAATT